MSDGWNKVIAINKYGSAEEYMMKASDEKKVGLSEFTAKERIASSTQGNGYIIVNDEYYQLQRHYTSLEEPVVIQSDIVTLERGSEDELKMCMDGDRDILLVEVSGDNYNYLMEEYSDDIGGMLGISDYIANIVDEVLSSDEYTSAVQYQRDGKGTRWDYFDIEYSTCLDWFFLDKANAIINREYPRLNKEA